MEIKDTFLWIFEPIKSEIFNEVREKGKVKIVYFTENNEKIEEIKDLKETKISSNVIARETKQSLSTFSSSSFDYGTYPNWHMFQVNPQHKGQYNYSVYPPLTYQWTYTLDYNDFLITSSY